MNSSGKVLVIFLVITAILLISLTAISLFFFQKETERRKVAETTLAEYQAEKGELELKLTELQKQNTLLQEKNKEADERLNDLSDELELEKGLREEIKIEKASLEEAITKLTEERDELAKKIEGNEGAREKLKKEISSSESKIKELEAELKAEVERSQKLGELYKEREEQIKELEAAQRREEQYTIEPEGQFGVGRETSFEPEPAAAVAVADGNVADDTVEMGVELQEIVVKPKTRSEDSGEAAAAMDGRILSVDTETEFVIVNLGSKDGLSIGRMLSVYRNDDYVGDLKVTRLQPDMSAADLVSPLSIANVRKDDHVKVK